MFNNPVEMQRVLEKWSSPDLKGMSVSNIENTYIKEGMARLLENQTITDAMGNPLFENAQASVLTNNLGGKTDGVADTDAYKFKPVSLALVRRSFPALFANQIVGVQPMSTPVGLAYALRTYYKGAPDHEAAWELVPEYSGFTGSSSGSSGTADAGVGAPTGTAEQWEIKPGGSYPELKVKFDQQTITAKSRKLAASFSIESTQDIKVMQGVDMEREMLNVLQYELIAELDRELIKKVKTVAVDTSKGGASASTFDMTQTATSAGYIDGRWSQEKLQSVVTSIIYQVNNIANTTKRGAGNFVVVSPSVATALQSVRPAFQGTDGVNASTSMANIGTLNSTIKVYRDQYAATDYALVGFKGTSNNDAGVIYAPYVTNLMNRAMAQEDFSSRIGIMSRYAIIDSLNGSGRYYRLINYSNMSGVIAGA